MKSFPLPHDITDHIATTAASQILIEALKHGYATDRPEPLRQSLAAFQEQSGVVLPPKVIDLMHVAANRVLASLHNPPTLKAELSIKALKSRFADKGREYYQPHYGKTSFDIWLNVMLPKIATNACARVDQENRRFTVPEIRQLASLYVRSMPFGYTYLPPERRPAVTKESLCAWIASLDGYGPAGGTLPVFRDRTPVEYGLLTPDYWANFVSGQHEPKDKALAPSPHDAGDVGPSI